jgi:hypothetical protein
MKHPLDLRTATVPTIVLIVVLVVLACGGLATATLAADYVICKRGGKTLHLTGQAIVTAGDGGIMLLAADGKLWNILPAEIVEHRQNEDPFAPLTGEELKKQILTELPAGFDAYSTAHYVIFYDTSRAYAQWCGALFERLYAAFTNLWTRRGFKLHDPQTPLIVVIYADRQTYAQQSADELANNAGRVIGFYSLQTNRVKTYDLTGLESLRQASGKRADSSAINEMLSRPEATTMVSTVIHEATHQIAFNCGLQQRFADIPLWMGEGLAMYFETPDLSFGKGWRTIGEVNSPRLERFQQYMQRRPADSLSTLISDDKRFRDTDTNRALDAYAEAWALNYFLLRQRPKDYQTYIERLSKKGPLVWDDSAERLKEFKSSFGNDLTALDNEFVRYMARVR